MSTINIPSSVSSKLLNRLRLFARQYGVTVEGLTYYVEGDHYPDGTFSMIYEIATRGSVEPSKVSFVYQAMVAEGYSKDFMRDVLGGLEVRTWFEAVVKAHPTKVPEKKTEIEEDLTKTFEDAAEPPSKEVLEMTNLARNQVAAIPGPPGPKGVGISDVRVTVANDLIVTLTNGQEINAGTIQPGGGGGSIPPLRIQMSGFQFTVPDNVANGRMLPSVLNPDGEEVSVVYRINQDGSVTFESLVSLDNHTLFLRV